MEQVLGSLVEFGGGSRPWVLVFDGGNSFLGEVGGRL